MANVTDGANPGANNNIARDPPAGIAYAIVGGNNNAVPDAAEDVVPARPVVGAVAGVPNRSKFIILEVCFQVFYRLFYKWNTNNTLNISFCLLHQRY